MFDIVLLIISIISLIQLVVSEFHIVLLSMPQAIITIINAMCYSLLGSAIFYLINVYLPKKSKDKHYKIMIGSKLDDLLKVRLMRLNARVRKFQNDGEDFFNYYRKSFIQGDIEKNLLFFNLLIDQIDMRCAELLAYSDLLEPKLLVKIDKLKNLCRVLNLENYDRENIQIFIEGSALIIEEILLLSDEINGLYLNNNYII